MKFGRFRFYCGTLASLRQNPTFTGIEDLKERKKRGLPTPPPLDAKAKTDGEVVRQGGHRVLEDTFLTCKNWFM